MAMSLAMSETPCGPLSRHATVGVRVGEGDAAVTIGGGAPIVVQSMTNTEPRTSKRPRARSRPWRGQAPNWCA